MITTSFMRKAAATVYLSISVAACGGGGGGGGSSESSPTPTEDARTSWVVHWNRVAIDASGYDHTSAGKREQMGPVRSIRAISMTQIAVADAVAAITGRFRSYLPVDAAPGADSYL